MGELFVTTNRIDKAKERLAVLDGCDCKEYSMLKEIIEGKRQSKYWYFKQVKRLLIYY